MILPAFLSGKIGENPKNRGIYGKTCKFPKLPSDSRNVIKTIFFDMDGTLVDTELAAAKAVEECFRAWNHRVTADDAHFVTGRTWEKACEYLFSKYPPALNGQAIASEEAVETLLEAYRKRIETDLIEVPGARKCVKDLAEEYPLALVSGSHRREILSILERLGIRQHFKVILGAEDYPQSKPAPDGFLKALSLMSADPDTTLVFEDSVAGIEAGLAAKLHVCVITSTNHLGANIRNGHHFVRDLSGVNRKWVKSLSVPANSG